MKEITVIELMQCIKHTGARITEATCHARKRLAEKTNGKPPNPFDSVHVDYSLCHDCPGPIKKEVEVKLDMEKIEKVKQKVTPNRERMKSEGNFKCKIHGMHGGALVGGRLLPDRCPTCLHEKRMKTMRETFGFTLKIKFDAQTMFILDFVQDRAKALGVTPSNWILGLITDSIDPEWFKQRFVATLWGVERGKS
jgi:hypothetical protein